MFKRGWEDLRRYWWDGDWQVVLVAAGLVACGLVFIQSAGGPAAAQSQALRVALSLPCFLGALLVSQRWVRENAFLLFALALVGLLIAASVGRTTNEARRWIDIAGGFKLQPSEFVKFGLVLALARILSRRRHARTVESVVQAVLITALPAVMVALQPDLGTALVLPAVCMGLCFAAGARMPHLGVLALVGLMLMPVLWMGMRPFQKQRVQTWMHQGQMDRQERLSTGYHLHNALVAVGSGGWGGAGLGDGPQNRLGYLPERESDFIFAVAAEETGFVGGAALIGLYATLVGLILGVASRVRDRFLRLTVVGVALVFWTHMFFNIGVATGLLPTTGIVLPLVSFGGSSTLAAMAALGWVLNVGLRREHQLARS